MNQPPNQSSQPPDWQRPPGVSAGTWDYVNQRGIANRYDAFVADVAMSEVEWQLLCRVFPALASGKSAESVAATEQLIVDLGCGTGRSAIPLARAGYEIIAIDLSRAMLQNLVANTETAATDRSGVPGIRDRVHPLHANLVELNGVADGSADHAICLFSTFGMIQGRQHRLQVLRNAKRIVKPGGSLLIHVHHRWAGLREVGGTKKLITSWTRSIVDRNIDFGDSVYAYRGLPDMFMHRFSKREITSDLRRAGWSLTELHRLSIDGKTLTGAFPIAGGFFLLAHC